MNRFSSSKTCGAPPANGKHFTEGVTGCPRGSEWVNHFAFSSISSSKDSSEWVNHFAFSSVSSQKDSTAWPFVVLMSFLTHLIMSCILMALITSHQIFQLLLHRDGNIQINKTDLGKCTHQCNETHGINNSAQALLRKIVFFRCKKIDRQQKKKEAIIA